MYPKDAGKPLSLLYKSLTGAYPTTMCQSKRENKVMGHLRTQCLCRLWPLSLRDPTLIAIVGLNSKLGTI